jgi:hypothetical protein
VCALVHRIDGVGNLVHVQFHNRPLWSAQHHNGYATASQVLLIADILVRGEKQIKASFLSNDPIPGL